MTPALYAGLVDVPECVIRGRRGDVEPLVPEVLPRAGHPVRPRAPQRDDKVRTRALATIDDQDLLVAAAHWFIEPARIEIWS
jgi:hypothetical protein